MAVITKPDHIVVVVEENHSHSQIIGSPDAPYINALAAQGTLFTDYHAITHPSEPNYFALFSGSTQGVTDDGTYHFSAPTLAGELQSAGLSFLGYAEAGSPQKHNPWQSFTDSQATGRDFSQFPTDFSQLPTVAFVSPNLQNDMHDGTVAQGDQWLRDHLGAYADWAQTHNSLLVVTFDENAGGGTNQITTLVTGAGVPAGHNDQYADHYSLLRTIEDTYGLPALGESVHATPLNLAQEVDWNVLAAHVTTNFLETGRWFV